MAVAVAFSAAGCVGPAKSVRTVLGGRTIALLPLDNRSNDVEAPARVRRTLAEEFRKAGAALMPEAEVDAGMKSLGLSESGQLGAVSFGALRAAIKADVICSGTLLDYGFKSAVALSQRKVQIELACRDAAGAEVFKGAETGITTKAGVDAAGDLVLDVAGKVVKSVKEGTKSFLPGTTAKQAADMTDVIADTDLTQETTEVARKLVERFPE